MRRQLPDRPLGSAFFRNRLDGDVAQRQVARRLTADVALPQRPPKRNPKLSLTRSHAVPFASFDNAVDDVEQQRLRFWIESQTSLAGRQFDRGSARERILIVGWISRLPSTSWTWIVKPCGEL